MITDIILVNFGVWINFLIPFVIALYLALTHREYIWREFGIQVASTFLYVGLAYYLLFSFTTNIMDEEYWNGIVSKFEYYEKWDELVTYTESYPCGKSTCTRVVTRVDHHDPYWEITTSNNESYKIKESEYNRAVRNFGHKEYSINRSSQVSSGDGDKYVSIPDIDIPTSVSHSYENLVVASKHNVINSNVNKETIEKLIKDKKLVNYPSSYRGMFGELLLDRIIDTTKTANTIQMTQLLNRSSGRLGKIKQVNPIIYITDEGRDFKYSLEYYWNKAKKNDAILILGVDRSTRKVVWSDSIAWTNNTDFLVECGSGFEGLSVKEDAEKIVARFSDLMLKEYVRKPMEEFSYLKENIALDWYWQLLVIIGNISLSLFLVYRSLNNWERK